MELLIINQILMKKIIFILLSLFIFSCQNNSYTKTNFWIEGASKISFGNEFSYPEGTPSITTAILVLQPGESYPVHKHPKPTTVIQNVLQGELTIVLVDKNKSVVTKAGETFISESDEWHYAKNDGKEVLISSGTILGEDGTPMMIMEEK